MTLILNLDTKNKILLVTLTPEQFLGMYRLDNNPMADPSDETIAVLERIAGVAEELMEEHGPLKIQIHTVHMGALAMENSMRN